MQTYTLTDARNRHGEVFDRAVVEPVLLTKQSRPSHVILSAQAYEALVTRLTELEDLALGRAAEVALSQSQTVGSDFFTTELRRYLKMDTSE
jgi:prevent-host-death family protein